MKKGIKERTQKEIMDKMLELHLIRYTAIEARRDIIKRWNIK